MINYNSLLILRMKDNKKFINFYRFEIDSKNLKT